MKITFPDGSVKEFANGSTGMDIALSISEGLARNALGIFVNGKKYDLSRKINEDANVRIVTFSDVDGKEIYWHSSAHLMAEAVQAIYPGTKFGIGPAIENGFYYDVDLPGDVKLTVEDLPKIEQKMQELAKAKSEYQRVEISWEEAIQHFKEVDDEYKLELLEGLKDDEITLYKQGNFVDLCRGTHVPRTDMIKSIKLLSVAGAYWRGDSDRKMMTRIYGITFPKKQMLDDYLNFLEEAKKRDHRKLGKELDLFSMHDEAGPGLIYWHPKGARIRMEIEDFWRKEHLKNGYEILYTPHVGRSWLWETSGHLGFYKDSMYSAMEIDEQDYYLKPMNCPFHIMIYKNGLRSYRDLPYRWAELGTVYRYEKSGVLHGLLRVRGFTQDDAHIFCTQEQIEDEVIEVIRFSNYMLNTFGFKDINYYLATKPEGAIGENALWDRATASLKNALNREGLNYILDEGGGAFYGPKIDLKIKDALNREWQLSTIQFDFNEPERFDMHYIGEDGNAHRPFMVHRALLGSIERFFGILIEHYAGNFPFWLAPVQISVLPITDHQHDTAKEIKTKLEKLGYRVSIDLRSEKVNRKIAESEQQKVPYAFIIGQKEAESGTVSVRKHGEGDLGAKSLEEMLNLFTELNKPGAENR
jgi:threonyl-tRNA synthetase